MKRHDLTTYEGLLAAIEDLTPLGSEFHQNPQRCLDYLARQGEMIKDAVKEARRLRAVVEAAVAWGKSTTPRDDMATESALIDALRELGGDDIC
jgi:hypothetical protein